MKEIKTIKGHKSFLFHKIFNNKIIILIKFNIEYFIYLPIQTENTYKPNFHKYHEIH